MSKYRFEEHEKTADYFNRRGGLFDSLYSFEETGPIMRCINKRFRRDIYERYYLTLQHLRKVSANSVLDIGVGGARYAQGYIECGIERAVGVDISHTMLEFAKKHVENFPDHKNIFEFVLSDIEEFRSDEKFDVVVAMGFFDYVADPQKTLDLLRTFCGNSVIASFPSISFYRTPIRRIRYKFKNCPVRFYRKDEIISMSNTAGFSTCNVTKIKGAGMDYVAVFSR